MEKENIDEYKAALLDAAKNWLAMDGLWFLAVENKYGSDAALEIDKKVWQDFSRIEAIRIKNRLGSDKTGIDLLDCALRLRLHALLNNYTIIRPERDVLELYMNSCRTQESRKRKDLPDFPCKSVGIIEYSVFADEIDQHIKTECIACPPDIGKRGFYCGWRFFYLNKT